MDAMVRTLAPLLLLLGACDGDQQLTNPPAPEPADEPAVRFAGSPDGPSKAIAQLHEVGDSGVSAVVELEPVDEGVRITVNAEGLAPGQYGFHVHEYGDCTADDGTSAGGHYNPTDTEHGAPDDPEDSRHVGDLGNLEIADEGAGAYDRVDPLLTLAGEHSVLGRALVIHAGEDDLKSQPSGDAGDRLACGVIGIAEE